MPPEFTIHRVVCSTPPGLEEERDLFLAVLAEFAERVSMPAGILFAPASFPTAFNATRMQGAVKENIKTSYLFLSIFGEDPTEAVYKRFVQYAIECIADPALPLRQVTLFFKESEDVAEEMHALHERFMGQCDVRVYRNLKELEPQFQGILAEWLASVKPVAQAG